MDLDFEKTGGHARPLEIGAMSRQNGGEIGTHRSHQTGRDVDIRLPRKSTVARFRPLTPKRVDWGATWKLIKVLATHDVDVVFLDFDMQKRLYKHAKAHGATEAELRQLLDELDDEPEGAAGNGRALTGPASLPAAPPGAPRPAAGALRRRGGAGRGRRR